MAWLNVNDYLPGDDDEIIIYFVNENGDGITTAYFFDDEFHIYFNGGWLDANGVTHWQSLPGPPLTLI